MLRSHGVRLYNVARALEPATMQVLDMRVFAVRCMEAGRMPKRTVLLCYIRTGLKARDLATGREVAGAAGNRLALAAFRRGFGQVSLAEALSTRAAKPENVSQEEHDFAASVFLGAFTFTELELAESDPGMQRLQFLCEQWRAAMETLGTRVKASFRKQTWVIARRLALLVYERGEHLESGLALFEAMERWFPAATFDEEARLDDLVAMADMQVATGNRGLASVTLETAQDLRRELAVQRASSSDGADGPRLTWKAVQGDGGSRAPAGSADEEKRRRETVASVQTLKEAAVRIKLGLAEVEALRPTHTLFAETENSYTAAISVARSSLQGLLEALSSFRDIMRPREGVQADGADPNEVAARVWTLVKLSCAAYCGCFGYDEKTFQSSYLEAEARFGLATSAQKVSMRIGVLRNLPATAASLTNLILEGIADAEIGAPETTILVGELWKRLVQQQQEGDEDGAATTARYLLCFGKHDKVVAAYAQLVLGEALGRRGAWKEAVEACTEAAKYREEMTPGARARLQSLLFEAQMRASGRLSREARESLRALLDDTRCSPAELAHCGVVAADVGALAEVAAVLASASSRDVVWVHLVLSVALARMDLLPSALAFEDENHESVSCTKARNVLGPVLDMMSAAEPQIDWTPSQRPRKQVEASLLWVQAVSWKLGRELLPGAYASSGDDAAGAMRPRLDGQAYTLCAKASEALLAVSDPPEEERIVLEERLAAAVQRAICSLADVVLEARVGEVLSEPGLALEDAVAARKVGASVLADLAWAQARAEKHSTVALIARYLLSPSAPQFVLHSAEKMIEFALFGLASGDHDGARHILQQALQVELAGVHPCGARIGRLLVLLVKYAGSETDAASWALQANQLGTAHDQAYMTQADRRYLSSWLWNLGVRAHRARKKDAAQTLRDAIRILEHAPRDHEDREKAAELRERLEALLDSKAQRESERTASAVPAKDAKANKAQDPGHSDNDKTKTKAATAEVERNDLDKATTEEARSRKSMPETDADAGAGASEGSESVSSLQTRVTKHDSDSDDKEDGSAE